MPSTTQVTNVAGPAASTGLSAALAALTGLGGVATAGIGAGVGALITLIGSIGQGRKDANTMTENGGPQDILNKQLAAISQNSGGYSQQEIQQATQLAWTQFLQAANQFAAKGPEYAQVAKQAIFQTPALTQTVQSLGGFNPLSSQFTGQLSSSIPGATPQSGISIASLLGDVAGGIGGATLGSALNGAGSAAAGSAGAGTDGLPAGVTLNEDGNLINADGTLYIPSATGAATTGATTAAAGAGAGAGATNSSTSLLNQIFGKNPISGILGAGTSILNGILQSGAAKNAASLQAGAANNAANLEAQTAANSLDFAKQIYAQEQQANAPFLQAGTNALSKVQQLLGPGGSLSQPFTAPTEAQVQQTPGYQLELDAALKALGNQTKGVVSGSTIKAADRYATDYADTKYQDALGNAQSIYQQNYSDTLQPLLDLIGSGQSAASLSAQTGQNLSNTNTNVSNTTAQNIGNLNQQAAAATAGGDVKSTNALTAALQAIMNQQTQQQALNNRQSSIAG